MREEKQKKQKMNEMLENGKKRFGIKGKLILSVLPCFVIAILVINFTVFISTKDSLTAKTSSLIKAEGKAGVQEIESWQNGVLSSLTTMVSSITEQKLDDEQTLSYLSSQLEKNDEYPNGMYITYSDAKVLDGSGWTPSIVATDGTWYKEGITHKTFAFGEPYLDSLTKEYIVTASVTIPDLNGKKAVAAADVSLSKLTDVIDTMTVADTGNAFIVDADTGVILANNIMI